jgi:diphthine-ammonia ligase
LERGFHAEVVAVKDGTLSPDFLGRELDAQLISELESRGIDLSGETGEYHTVVVDGPLFKNRLKTRHGKLVLKDGYWFSDVSLEERQS